MEELTIEQKAKAYDEAIKKASIAYKDEDRHLKATLERIFPELKESEDERIKKAICNALKYLERKLSWDFLDDVDILDAYAWLEKQGEKPQGKSALEAIKEEKVDNQNCVKPADKVEPEFKVSDWLTENHPNNYARFMQILEIVNVQGKNRYRISRDLHNDEDIIECSFIEDKWHPFNIQDAKDGDVLSFYGEYKGNKMVQVGIIEKYVGKHGGCSNSFKIYVGVNWENNLQIGKYMGCSDMRPATKEQRDTLFAKMREAGYEWDAEKKELKKIEDEPENYKQQLMSGITNLIEDYIRQKPVKWDEEDELNSNLHPEVTFENSPQEVELKLVEQI